MKFDDSQMLKKAYRTWIDRSTDYSIRHFLLITPTYKKKWRPEATKKTGRTEKPND
jgi:hypothetical protein